jgi:hypothetical protein
MTNLEHKVNINRQSQLGSCYVIICALNLTYFSSTRSRNRANNALKKLLRNLCNIIVHNPHIRLGFNKHDMHSDGKHNRRNHDTPAHRPQTTHYMTYHLFDLYFK